MESEKSFCSSSQAFEFEQYLCLNQSNLQIDYHKLMPSANIKPKRLEPIFKLSISLTS